MAESDTSGEVRVVVIGVGHLGTYHAEKISNARGARLVGVVDIDKSAAAKAAEKFGVATAGGLEAFAGKADAVIIAAPTPVHFEIGKQALGMDLHVLMEKPITTSVDQAEKLVALAAERGRVLQVGHTERFNPAIDAALKIADRPRYIVTERLGPFTGRSAETDVILDLMIHDLDIVASMIPSEIVEVRAVGVPVLTSAVDMAAARLQFADGSVAQLSAGRASLEPSRKIRLFTVERYLSIDCATREVKSVRRLPPEPGSDWPQIMGEPIEVPEGDALANQDQDFIDAIRQGRAPRVGGDAGIRALKLADAVRKEMKVPSFEDLVP